MPLPRPWGPAPAWPLRVPVPAALGRALLALGLLPTLIRGISPLPHSSSSLGTQLPTPWAKPKAREVGTHHDLLALPGSLSPNPEPPRPPQTSLPTPPSCELGGSVSGHVTSPRIGEGKHVPNPGCPQCHPETNRQEPLASPPWSLYPLDSQASLLLPPQQSPEEEGCQQCQWLSRVPFAKICSLALKVRRKSTAVRKEIGYRNELPGPMWPQPV